MAPTAENGTASRHDRRFHERPRVQVQQHDHDEQRQRDDVREARAHAGHRFVLAAPEHCVARRQLDLLAHHPTRLVHVAADVAAGDVHEHVSGEQSVLVADHRGSCRDLHARQLAEWNLPLSIRRRHEHTCERVGVGSEIAHVADVHRVPLAPLDRGGHVLAADRVLHHALRRLDAQPVAGERVAVPLDVEEESAGGALREHVARAAHRGERRLDRRADLLDLGEIAARDLQPDRRADPGRSACRPAP